MFVVFSIVGTNIAWVARRVGLVGLRTVEDFYATVGRFGGLLAAMTYAATTYSSFMLVGLAYVTGVGSLRFEFAYLLATIGVLCLWGFCVWELAR